MRYKFSYLVPLLAVFACNPDSGVNVDEQLPGTYSRTDAPSPTAKVYERLEIGERLGQTQDFPVTRFTRIHRFRNKAWTLDSSTRALRGRYNPTTRELLLIQRGKTYRVNFELNAIMDAADTLYKQRSPGVTHRH